MGGWGGGGSKMKWSSFVKDESERRNLCLLKIWVNRNISSAQQTANEGDRVRGLSTCLRRRAWLELPKDALSKASKSPKPTASPSECRIFWSSARFGQLTLPGLSDSQPNWRLWPRSEFLSFLVTLNYFPVSSPVVQLSLYLHRKELVIPPGNGSVAGAGLTLSAAGSQAAHIQTRKEAQLCVGCDIMAQLTTRLGGGFNSLGPRSPLVTTRQKSPWLQLSANYSRQAKSAYSLCS